MGNYWKMVIEMEPEPPYETPTYYIGICIRKSGHAAVRAPTTDLNECLEDMKAYAEKHFDNMLATTYITRKSDKPITLQDVFGKPKSRDLMQDRKWIKSIGGAWE